MMKSSISISTFRPQFAPIPLQSDSLEEFDRMCALASSVGYEGIDLFVDKKAAGEINQINDILVKNGLKVAMLICIYLSEQGVNLTYQDRDDRVRACEIYKGEMKLAEILNAATMPVGLLRGSYLPSDSCEAYQERLAESCRMLMPAAAERNIKLCIEPVNRYEIDTLNTVQECMDFISKFELQGMYLVPDLFHMNIEDTDLCGTLEKAAAYIAHMHVADSNRRAPGLGNLDYESILGTLKKIGYDGYLTVEALNYGQPAFSAEQGARYLSATLDKIYSKH